MRMRNPVVTEICPSRSIPRRRRRSVREEEREDKEERGERTAETILVDDFLKERKEGEAGSGDERELADKPTRFSDRSDGSYKGGKGEERLTSPALAMALLLLDMVVRREGKERGTEGSWTS